MAEIIILNYISVLCLLHPFVHRPYCSRGIHLCQVRLGLLGQDCKGKGELMFNFGCLGL